MSSSSSARGDGETELDELLSRIQSLVNVRPHQLAHFIRPPDHELVDVKLNREGVTVNSSVRNRTDAEINEW